MDPSQPTRSPRAPRPRRARGATATGPRLWAALFGLVSALGGAGCAAGPAEDVPAEPALPMDASKDEIEARRAALRMEIDADHARLETLVRTPQADGPEGLNRNPELRLLADRLERKRAALRRLDARRSAVDR